MHNRKTIICCEIPCRRTSTQKTSTKETSTRKTPVKNTTESQTPLKVSHKPTKSQIEVTTNERISKTRNRTLAMAGNNSIPISNGTTYHASPVLWTPSFLVIVYFYCLTTVCIVISVFFLLKPFVKFWWKNYQYTKIRNLY